MPAYPREAPAKKRAWWPHVAGIVVIYVSLWALHRFCDGYSDATLSVWARRSPLAEPVCSRWLGGFTLAAGTGYACLLGAGLLQWWASSRGLLRLSAGLAVAGRMIALLFLGLVVLLLVLFNQF